MPNEAPPTEDNNLSFSRKEIGAEDTVKVVKINKAKVSYFFTDRIPDMQTFFDQGEIEFRITIGKNWDNYIAVNKTPLLKYFRNYHFSRSCETHYTRNLMMFSDNLEGMNLRLTLGVALDKQTDVSDVPESDMKPYLTDCLYYPPMHYSNQDIHLNILPQAWFSLLTAERTPLI